jgi:tetratricopeptide (TPR) repeat protein
LFSLVNDALLNDYENAELWKLRAQCLEHIDGRLDDALEAYEQYFHHMKSTDDPIAELHRIIVMLRLGRHEEAYPMFDTVLPKLQKEQRALALVHKAAAAYALQRYVEALSAADHSLLGKIPEGAKPLALRYKAASLIKLNRATEGLEIIDSIDTKDLGTTLTSFLLKVRIDALIQLDRSQDALAVFEQLQQSGSEDPELPFIRAQLLVATDKPAEGLEEAMKLSEKHPENIILMRTKALALTKLNKPAEAAPIWQALIMKNHRDISASMWYAVCLFGMGNHIEAVARLESLLPMLEKPGLESMLSDALTYYGQSLFLLRSYERAITPLQRVAQMKPTKIVLKQLAASWMYMQNYGEALRWTEQALLANPNDSQLKRMKVQLIDIVREQNTDDVADDEEGEYDDDEDGEEGEYGGEDAVAGAGDSRQASPEDIQRAHKHLAVGLSSYYNGNYKKALDHINNALEVFPEFAEAWEIRAQCLQKLGRNNEAFEAAQIARRIKSMDD